MRGTLSMRRVGCLFTVSKDHRAGEEALPQCSTPVPSRTLSGLLCAEDAASMLSEACHRAALADESAEACAHAASAVRDARRRWDDLRHRHDPRHRRHVNVRAGLSAVALLASCLLILDTLLLRGVTGRQASFPLATCATTTWLMAAWRGALANQEDQRRLRVLVAAGTAALSLLLAVVYVLAPAPRPVGRWHQVALAAVIMLLIDALTAGAAALISRIEPADVAAARTHWRRAHKQRLKAQRQEHEDTEAAAAARRAWLDFVRQKARALASRDGDAMLADAQQAIDRPGQPRSPAGG